MTIIRPPEDERVVLGEGERTSGRWTGGHLQRNSPCHLSLLDGYRLFRYTRLESQSATTTVMLSVPPPSLAAQSSTPHACFGSISTASTRAMRSSSTICQSPSLHNNSRSPSTSATCWTSGNAAFSIPTYRD